MSRSDSYYNRDSFQEIIESLVGEQDKDIHYMYLVMNTQGEVIGRVNLTDVIKEPLNKAELGYRIGEKKSRERICNCSCKASYEASVLDA